MHAPLGISGFEETKGNRTDAENDGRSPTIAFPEQPAGPAQRTSHQDAPAPVPQGRLNVVQDLCRGLSSAVPSETFRRSISTQDCVLDIFSRPCGTTFRYRISVETRSWASDLHIC